MRRDQRLDLSDQVGVATRLEVRIDSSLEDRQAGLVEAGDLALESFFAAEVGERWAPPKLQRSGELGGALARRERPGVGDQSLEPTKIERVRVGAQYVAPLPPHQHIG